MLYIINGYITTTLPLQLPGPDLLCQSSHRPRKSLVTTRGPSTKLQEVQSVGDELEVSGVVCHGMPWYACVQLVALKSLLHLSIYAIPNC